MTSTLAETSASLCSPREGVTVTVSRIVAGDSTISMSRMLESGISFSANPAARTMIVAEPEGALSMAKCPSGPVTVCSSPDPLFTTTEARRWRRRTHP